jgi:RimJ/RimL family protein N-acetyltransferase
MNYYPFPNRANFDSEMARLLKMPDAYFTAILAPSGKDKKMKAVGIAAMIRIDPSNGVLELGPLINSPSSLQRTAGSTELMYLLIQHAFNLGYRRIACKIDKLNEPSNKAALRFGFTFEGIFRQAAI